MRFLQITTLCCLLLFCGGMFVFAKGVYKTADQFLAQAFPTGTSQQNALWITGDLRERTADVLGHQPTALRVRYWRNDDEDSTSNKRTAWILDEIGKELPITIGVVVDASGIERVEILEFRESRGGEVRHDFFTQQFFGVRLNRDSRLDQSIDNITGATLSVRAVKRVAALALLFHHRVMVKQH